MQPLFLHDLLLLTIGAAATAVSAPAVMRLATALGALASPGGRHVHSEPVPRMGGLAIGLGVCVAALAARYLDVDRSDALLEGHSGALFVAGSMLIALVGARDDVEPLSPIVKLSGQIVAALLAVEAGFTFSVVTNPFTGSTVALGALGGVAVVLWILLITNAVNLVDGLDGLASGLAVIAATTIYIVASLQDQTATTLAAVLIAGSVIGFLPFNSHPARVFLGDTGSLLLGYWLALLSIQGVQKGPTLVLALVPVFALGLPILDVTVTVLRRALVAGLAAVVQADREHIHHRMMANGLTHRRAVMALYGAALVSGGLGVLTSLVHTPAAAVVVVVAAVAVWASLRWLGYGQSRRVDAGGIESGDAADVAIVVLGDLALSPRMQYHALALAGQGRSVDLIGYVDSPLPAELEGHPHVACHALRDPMAADRSALPRPVFVIVAAARLLVQTLVLGRALAGRVSSTTTLLVQTPPALPTLVVVWAVARLRGCRFVIDWHNFGDSMLALRLGAGHALVRAAGGVEGAVGRRADEHFCVSVAMQRELQTKWGIRATVLPDRPASRFRPLPLPLRGALFERLPELVPGYRCDAASRPALIVSPTSWTADEDFAMLLEAAVAYDANSDANSDARSDARSDATDDADAASLPPLLLLITGRGPLKAHYEALFRSRLLRRVEIRTGWLSAEDYPLLLGAADLGVSMHRSSSGVDLPMKVADMLGSGLPVCMFEYGPCAREGLDAKQGGMFFATAAELAEHWALLLDGFPDRAARLTAARRDVAAAAGPTWEETWQKTARPVLVPGDA